MTVIEHLQFIARVKGLTPREFEANSKLILRTLEMVKQEQTLARDLSASDKKKLAVAITLLTRPQIEIWDEPASEIDVWARRGLLRVITDLKETSNAALLMTGSKIEELECLCDKIAIMVNGKIIGFGSPEYMLKQYGCGYELTAVDDITKSDYLQAY